MKILEDWVRVGFEGEKGESKSWIVVDNDYDNDEKDDEKDHDNDYDNDEDDNDDSDDDFDEDAHLPGQQE